MASTYADSAPVADSTTPDRRKERDEPEAVLRRYWREIERYKRATEQWEQMGEKIVKLYLDEHRTHTSPRRFALLWSNVETLKPAVYAKSPIVLCSRRYKDPDPVARKAAEILERAVNTSFELYGVDEVLRMVRDDRLLVGRGQAWVRYEADFEDGEGYEQLSGEKVCVDYLHWQDFGHNPARVWKDAWLVWRRVYKTRDEVEERFGEDIASRLSYTAKPPEDKDAGLASCGVLYEIWDKKRKRVAWISKEYKGLIDDGEPPLDFRAFFPCPEPCYGTKTSKSLIPTPDYRYYQDQANEIDDLTEKICALSEWLIVKGFIPSGPSSEGPDAIRTLIESLTAQMSSKGLFVPVESWSGFQERGGAGKVIDWLPIDMVVTTLKTAIEARNQLVQDVYQITGISDILRGQTDPDETLGAQQLKAQTGSRRVKNAKDEMARFANDIGRLVAEVIAEMFQPQTLADMSGFKYQPAPPPMPIALNASPPAALGGLPMVGGQPPQVPPGLLPPPVPPTAPGAMPDGL